MLSKTDILSVIDAYLAGSSIQEKTLSGRIFDDQKKIGLMRGNSDITLTRANNAMIWLSQNWPADATWPDGVWRPEIAEAA